MINTLLVLSGLGVLGLAGWQTVRQGSWRTLGISAGLLAAVFFILSVAGLVSLPWQDSGIQARGTESNGSVFQILALYLAMIVGMLSHVLFSRLELPRDRRKKFRIESLLAPIFVSPIVFLPLATVFDAQSSPVESRQSLLMLLLVAYENGFFWREFFENRWKRHQPEPSHVHS